MKIAIGSDHAGFLMKRPIIEYLKSHGYQVVECGSFTPEPVDFPDIAQEVCAAVVEGKVERGIMVCGTGVGACIAANKIRGIRASVCHDVRSAHQCVEHDDVNVMCLGAQIVGDLLAFELVSTFLNATFSTEEEFVRRVEKLSALESDN